MLLAKEVDHGKHSSGVGGKRAHSAVAPVSTSKRKKPRDMPRRPLSAYNMYFQEERKRTIAKYERGEPQDDFHLPDGKDPSEALFQALSRTVANRWKAMPDEERAPYYERAKEEMKKYREKMDEYNQKLINSSALARRLAANQREEIEGHNRESEVAGFTTREGIGPAAVRSEQTTLTRSQQTAAPSASIIYPPAGQNPMLQSLAGGQQQPESLMNLRPQEHAQLLRALSMASPNIPYAGGTTPNASSALYSTASDGNLAALLQLHRQQ